MLSFRKNERKARKNLAFAPQNTFKASTLWLKIKHKKDRNAKYNGN